MLKEVITTISFIFTLINSGFNTPSANINYPTLPTAGVLEKNSVKASNDDLRETTHLSDKKSSAIRREVNYLEEIRKLNITLHHGTASTQSNEVKLAEIQSLNHCAELAYKTLRNLPQEPVSALHDLTLHFDKELRRGLGGGSRILLRCNNVTDSEVVAVLIHEIGHIQDTGVFQGNVGAGESEFKDGKNSIYRDDPSLEFYRLSFINESTRKKGSSDLDFVSGYASSDAFEDFAESFNYYILHGEEFRKLAAKNAVLEKKYTFLKEKVFQEKEYFNGDMANITVSNKRNYDTTVLTYNLSKFFAI